MYMILFERKQIDIISDPVNDQDEFVPLPDLNEEKSDADYYRCDYSLLPDDSVQTDNESNQSELIPNDKPLYPNQMQDPKVQQISDDFYNNLSD